ncbi:MAG: DUF2085 domain-containing protein [Chlorobi bacterium]|nr:DUF2085 domain-containing protein [Chlorobiota bacterium]MCI0716306.1 DUF2085 domain-containing protein [Chlorobiota bacterium]
MEIKRYQKIIYTIVLAVSLIWCGGILVAPLWAVESGFKQSLSDGFYSFYSSSCHQLDERSFHLNEYKFGVCSRCTSIYFGFLFGIILYPFIRKLNNIELPSLLYLFIGVVLMVIDVGLDIAGVVKNSFITREISGSILGAILPFYIIPGIIRVFYEFFTPPNLPAAGGSNTKKVIPRK